ncbi:D-hexose-6-phosphate mutarotase [Paraglaciecola aestuariivivens]
MPTLHSLSYKTKGKLDILHLENAFGSVDIALFGGQVLSYIPKSDGRERLWLSESAILDGSKAIRGGVPICWPWFGAHPSQTELPAHGYVRTQNWELIHASENQQGTTIELKPSSSQGAGFAGKAELSLIIHLGQELSIALHTRNLSEQSFRYNCALHSYFKVQDINHTELLGVTGQYTDKLQNNALFDTPVPYRLTQETDRVHLTTPARVEIRDKHNSIDIQHFGHDSLVVWNPWQAKSASMADMTAQGYESMLCVETAITAGQEVKAQETHVLKQVIR